MWETQHSENYSTETWSNLQNNFAWDALWVGKSPAIRTFDISAVPERWHATVANAYVYVTESKWEDCTTE